MTDPTAKTSAVTSDESLKEKKESDGSDDRHAKKSSKCGDKVTQNEDSAKTNANRRVDDRYFNGSNAFAPEVSFNYFKDNPFNRSYNANYYQMPSNGYYGYPGQPFYDYSHRQSYPSYRPQSYPNYSQRHHKHTQTLTEDEIREKVSKYRPFMRAKSSKSKTNGIEFSIMSYNILSQNLLEDHSSLYQHCQPSHIQWPLRGHRIVRELLESEADIICLQEVHSQHLKELIAPELSKHGYNVVYERKTGNKLDGCVIAFKDDVFSLLKSTKLELMRRDVSHLLDRDNIGLIVELRPKLSTNSKLIVANTHLLYNPKRGDIKLAQTRLLLAELDKLALISANENVFEYNPIILCGDFNSDPKSLLHHFITTGALNLEGSKMGDISGQRNSFGIGKPLEYRHLNLSGVTSDSRYENPSNQSSAKDTDTENMLIKHNFKLRSIFSDIRLEESNSRNKLISTSNQFESSLVDYIFYDYKKLKLMKLQRLMTANEMKDIQNIPNAFLGSDHLSLKAKFLMT